MRARKDHITTTRIRRDDLLTLVELERRTGLQRHVLIRRLLALGAQRLQELLTVELDQDGGRAAG